MASLSSEALPGVAVAYSGGRDSTALLHATLQAAADQDVTVWALHVHHGLSPQADAWERHCSDRCAAWSAAGWRVGFASVHLPPSPHRPNGTEAWARDARYAALAEMADAAGIELVLLAHHRRDQAETVVLQALRGGGVDGWAGMPTEAERVGITWARPWLDMPRTAIDDYCAAHGLRCIEDESNDDPRHSRNRLRLQVWPALIAAFPQAEQALAGAARRAQEASSCLADLARLDLGDAVDGGPLDILAWQSLSPARRGNALHAWLRAATGRPAPATVIARLRDEVPASTRRGAGGRWWALPGGCTVRCWRGRLVVVAAPSVPSAPPGLPPFRADAAVPSVDMRSAGLHRVPGWPGRLRVTAVDEGGVVLELLRAAELRPRLGGELFQAATNRPTRSLKLQYQAAGVPAWMRGGPLVYAGGQLVFVPGLGLDARVLAPPGVPQAALMWEPDPDFGDDQPR